MLWQLVVAAAALCAAYYRWSRRRLYRLAGEVPSGMKDYPIVGNAYKFLGSSEDRMKTIQEFGNIANKQGGFSTFWLGNQLFFCTTDPKTIEVVLMTCLEKYLLVTKCIQTVLGNGKLFAPVKTWRSRRRIMAPFFNLKNLNQLVPLFHEKSSIMADLMRAEAGGGDFSILQYMTTTFFDTVIETGFGTKMNSQESLDHFILQAITKVAHMLSQRVLQPWLHFDFIYQRLAAYKEFSSHMQRANDFAHEIIRRRRTGMEDVELKGKGSTNFLDYLIQSSGKDKAGYSDEELSEELKVLVVAGSDTSSSGSCFTAVLLSWYPDVQDRVYRELQEVFGNSDREVTPGDLPRLKYLEAVIKETLRLYPLAPIIERKVHEDLLLPSGITLVAGISMVVNIWGTHRNPAYWGEDAELFHPERFLLEGPLRHHTLIYLLIIFMYIYIYPAVCMFFSLLILYLYTP